MLLINYISILSSSSAIQNYDCREYKCSNKSEHHGFNSRNKFAFDF